LRREQYVNHRFRIEFPVVGELVTCPFGKSGDALFVDPGVRRMPLDQNEGSPRFQIGFGIVQPLDLSGEIMKSMKGDDHIQVSIREEGVFDLADNGRDVLDIFLEAAIADRLKDARLDIVGINMAFFPDAVGQLEGEISGSRPCFADDHPRSHADKSHHLFGAKSFVPTLFGAGTLETAAIARRQSQKRRKDS
jgi:hypothetical protein